MFDNADTLEMGFWLCAIAGTLLFALKSLLSLVGGVEHHVDVGIHAHDVAHTGVDGSDAAFELLSINSILGFIMMFGWVGLSSYKQFSLGEVASICLALVAGAATMYFTASLFHNAMKLVSHGAQFKLADAIGKHGTVYNRIVGNGKGRIQIAIQNVTREIDAVSDDGVEIESGKSIEVVKVVDDETVQVKLLKR